MVAVLLAHHQLLRYFHIPPVLFPIAVNLGIAPAHFSVVMVLNFMVGLLKPPVGMVLIPLPSIFELSMCLSKLFYVS
jgi:TRAP-type C4-dicarboxylate transport system permease large subunit